MELLTYLLIGAVAGFAAGLFGVGGGLIVVPVLYIVFMHAGYGEAVSMHLALGTSLATIMVTSISSMLAHNKNHAVLWLVLGRLTPGLTLGSFGGAAIADALSGQKLQLVIGIFTLVVGINMFRSAQIKISVQHRQSINPNWHWFAGAVIGIASALFGIGGGSLTVPYLNRSGLSMQQAVGTSAACGLPIAVAGALGFMFFGVHEQIHIAHTIGYVHIYAFIGISIMSFITARQGAKVAHRLSPAILKKCFACLLLFMSVYFLSKALLL
ncbi:sulfite exporter TauE/SafE family protein [Snodgrassella gandavensis]|uniref:sulfite exporter TauE/SafE family protein n=1 Tax=Snodgrassella gandavensis TaxID=2946698 RepID=UPI001EF4858B|nr:sulfite exporter TauE/SafE family protein [Snodgrassella gandavensis]